MKKEISNFYKNKKILITGHTGFKGSWLTLFLLNFKSKIFGISKDYPSYPNHFSELKLKNKIKHYLFDLSDKMKTKNFINKIKPQIIFHLAAQPLVKKSYEEPYLTWRSNFYSTLNILEYIKNINYNCVIVLITSDKCYEENLKKKFYKEEDRLGGIDPYSASKACVELLFKSYYNSFLIKKKNIKICTARAGNVVGGGYWANDIIIPDLIKSIIKKKKTFIRQPKSVRPWQHVLDPIYGYLKIAYLLTKNKNINGESFNFGPDKKNKNTVLDLLKIMKLNWNQFNWKIKKENRFKETKILSLDCSKAKKKLGWKPVLSFKRSATFTAIWYKNYYKRKRHISTQEQINDFIKYVQ
jgi:CDP-glucose 4,6-dehydratase